MVNRVARAGAIFLASCATAVLVGCGGSSSSAREVSAPGPDRPAAARELIAQAHARRPAVHIPTGYDVRRVPGAGFSLAFPRQWTTLAQPDVVFPGVIRTLARAHRSLTPSLLGLAGPESPLKLLAFHGRAGESFATTASVFVGPAPPGATFERQGRAIVRAIRTLGVEGKVEVRRRTLPAGEALRLEYRRKGTVAVQYVTVRGEQLYALVYVTRPELKPRYAPQFEASARTLSFVG